MDEAERLRHRDAGFYIRPVDKLHRWQSSSRDVRLSSDGTLDLNALDALAVKFAPGYCTAELDDFDRDAFVSKDTHRRFLLAKNALLHVAPEASDEVVDEDVEEGKHANWISSKWGTHTEPTADGATVLMVAPRPLDNRSSCLKAGLTEEIHSDDVVDKHDDGHFNACTRLSVRVCVTATQGAQTKIATHVGCHVLVHRPVPFSPAPSFALLRGPGGPPGGEKAWPKDVGAALRTGLAGGAVLRPK